MGVCGSTARQADTVERERVDEVGDPGHVVELHHRRRAVGPLEGAHAFGVGETVEHRRLLRIQADDRAGPVALGQLVRRARHQRVPVFEHDDLVGEALRLEQQVRAHHDRRAGGGHLTDELEHREGRLRVEARSRLVEQQQLRPVQHRARQREPGLHPRRVAAGTLVERVVDAEARRGCADHPIGRVAPAEAIELGRVGEVVVAGEQVVERGLGRHDTATAADVVAVDDQGRGRTPAPSPRAGRARL